MWPMQSTCLTSNPARGGWPGVGTRILVHDIAHVEMLVVDAHYQKETRDAMEAQRCTFFRPLPLVYIPIVADRRRLSPIVADSRPKIRAMKKRFAKALWPTCAKCACEKLTFKLSLDNDIKQPQASPFGW